MMAGLPQKTFLEQWVTPTVVFALASAITGQLLFTVWWARGESARITAVEVLSSGLRNDIFTLNTPLSSKVLKLEDAHADIDRQLLNLASRFDNIDQSGTRALALVTANQQRVMNQVDRLAERLIMMDKRIGDADIRSVHVATIATEKMSQVDKRLDALDKRLAEILALISHGPFTLGGPPQRFTPQGDSKPAPQ